MNISSLPDLPVASRLGEIRGLRDGNDVLVIEAEPGAGKTTLVPIALSGLLDADPGKPASGAAEGRVLVLEPRRLACVQAATRIADIIGPGSLGSTVGYRFRGASKTSASAKIEVVTEALLTRMVLDDFELPGIHTVIFDEYHERSINADEALNFCLLARPARPDLRIVIMSATIDAEAIEAFLRKSGVEKVARVSVRGRCFPVEVKYDPLPPRERFDTAFAALVSRAFASEEGDLLAFLPGVGEIESARKALAADPVTRDAEILSLHGSLSIEEQRRVVAPPGVGRGAAGREAGRRIILSTSIAQTSLTVPGIGIVVDSGLSRINRYQLKTGLDCLVTERVSRADADQRAGRAGRLSAGACFRAWEEGETLKPCVDPEILRADISSLVLDAAVWGGTGLDGLHFPNPPLQAQWDQARDLLGLLGMLDRAGNANARGKRACATGLPPRLAALALSPSPALGAACAAILSDRDQSGLDEDPDLRSRLDLLSRALGAPVSRAASGLAPVSRAWLERAATETRRILAVTGSAGPFRWSDEEAERTGSILMEGFPDRVAKREGDAVAGLFRFPSGRVAKLNTRSRSSLSAEEWIVAPEVDAGRDSGRVFLCAPLSKNGLRDWAQAPRESSPLVTVREAVWRERGAAATMRERVLFGDLELARRNVAAAGGDAARAFAERACGEGLAFLPFDAAGLSMLSRARFRDRLEGREDFSESALVAAMDDWLVPFAESTGTDSFGIGAERLRDALQDRIRVLCPGFAKDYPETIALPSGRRARVIYDEGDQAIVEARLQDCFGMKTQPLIGGRKAALRLLSPANRPVQTTTDIAGFWKGSYAQVRKDMRGRYPKHAWPEDPSSC